MGLAAVDAAVLFCLLVGEKERGRKKFAGAICEGC
jgi:hypothetical protein